VEKTWEQDALQRLKKNQGRNQREGGQNRERGGKGGTPVFVQVQTRRLHEKRRQIGRNVGKNEKKKPKRREDWRRHNSSRKQKQG